MCVYFLFLLILLMVFQCTTHLNMGKTPCCDKHGLKKGAWTEEEDRKLLSYVRQHGEGGWRSLPQKAGLLRCGKSCRLRWSNYLRPGIKRGGISPEEEQIIIRLHAALGNRWSTIARHLHRRTDNEIKNYWNTRLKRRVAEMTRTTSTTITTMDYHHASDHQTSFGNGTTNLAPNPNNNVNFPKSNQERERASSSSSSPPPHAHETHEDRNKSPILSHHDHAISCTTSITTTATPTATSSSVRILNKIASNLTRLNLRRVVVDGSASESSSADGTRPGSSVGELSPQCGSGGGGYSSGSPASSTPSNNVDPFDDGSSLPVVPLSQQAGFSPLCWGQVQLMCQQDLELNPLEMLLSDTAAYDIAEDMEDCDNNNNDYNNNDDDDIEQMLVTSFPNGFLDQQMSSLDRTDLNASITSNN